MNGLSEDQVVELLRAALPVRSGQEPSDLWPRVRRRIEQQAPRPGPADWVLAGILLLHF
jgi:hypothetical protein